MAAGRGIFCIIELDFLPVGKLKAAPELSAKCVRYFFQIGR
nr:MAG TPA: hypothetical protein [Caudoviricetes sp.]